MSSTQSKTPVDKDENILTSTISSSTKLTPSTYPIYIKDCVVSTFKYPEVITLYDNNYRPVIFSPYEPLDSKSLDHKGIVKGEYVVPKELIPKFSEQIMTFTIDNTLESYTNSIRRVLVTELSTYALHVDNSTFVVMNDHDKIIDYDKVNVIVTAIPLRQDLVKSMNRFYLHVINESMGSAGAIYTRDIKNKSGVSIVDLGLCNDMELFEIYPRAELKTELEIKFLNGATMGQHSAAYRVCMKSDVSNIDPATGVKSHIRRPFKMSFSTNGNYDCSTLLIDALENIKNRYDELLNHIELFLLSVSNGNFVLSINNETHTILEPINVECLSGRFRNLITFSAIHKSVDPYIKFNVIFKDTKISRADGLQTLKDIITDCKNNFTLSKDSINNIKNATKKDLIVKI